MRFAAYCTTFCCKQPKSRCKLQFYAMYIHFACINNHLLLAPKQTFAGIDFLRSNGRLVDYKGTHNVKIYAENKTKWGTLVSEGVGVLVGLCVGYLVSLCVSRFISLPLFLGYIHVLPRINGVFIKFYRIFVKNFVHERGEYFVFSQHRDSTPLSIYRNKKGKTTSI